MLEDEHDNSLKIEDEHEAEAVWISVVYFLAFEPCIMLKFHTVHQS